MARASSSSSSSPRAKRVSRPPQKYTPSSPNNGQPRFSSQINDRSSSPTKGRSLRSSPRQPPPTLTKGKRKREEVEDADEADDEQDQPAKSKKGRNSRTPTSRRNRRPEPESEVEQDQEMEDVQEQADGGDTAENEDEEEAGDTTVLSPISTRSKSREGSQSSSVAASPTTTAVKRAAASSSKKSRSTPAKGKEKAKEAKESNPSSNVSALLSTTSSDLYFQSHQSSRSKKYATSSNLISTSLGTLSSNALERVSSTITSTSTSTSPFSPSSLYPSIRFQSKKRFQTWNALLVTGHSLIFHGIGEKSKILQEFLKERAENGEGNVCVIRGHIPGLRIETILDWIEKAAKTIPETEDEGAAVGGDFDCKASHLLTPSSIRALSSKLGLSNMEARALSIIRYLEFSSFGCESSDDGSSAPPLYVLFNNMDSPILTSKNSRKVINILASSHRIRMLGTVDHWNSSLLVGAGGSIGVTDEIGLESRMASASSSKDASWPSSLISKPSYLQIHLSTYLPPTASIQLSRPGVRIAGLPKVLIPAGGIGASVGSNLNRKSGTASNPSNDQSSKDNQPVSLDSAKMALRPIPDRALRMFRRLVEATFKKIELMENKEREKNREATSSNDQPASSTLTTATASTASTNSLPTLSHSAVMKLAAKEFIMQENTLSDVLKEPQTHHLLSVRDEVGPSATETMEDGFGPRSRKIYQIMMGRKELKQLVEEVSKWPNWRYTSEMN